MANAGEEDEPKIIAKLASLKGTNIESIGLIKSVASYNGLEYQQDITIRQVNKAPTSAKRDVIINGKGYSLKSIRKRPPAIVNHTTREKWIRICQVIGEKIDLLDEMVAEYWDLRVNGKIGEDTFANRSICPFVNTERRRKYLKQLIDYFLFYGTGSKGSEYPAEYILQFSDPSDPQTWTVLSKETAFEALLPNMIFSLRSKKGMPPGYPRMSDAKKKALIDVWVKKIDGDYRGSLHIRSS